jgi:hypothetical protein
VYKTERHRVTEVEITIPQLQRTLLLSQVTADLASCGLPLLRAANKTSVNSPGKSIHVFKHQFVWFCEAYEYFNAGAK